MAQQTEPVTNNHTLTAVEWLQDQYDNCPESFLTDDDFKKAKEMEREQIEIAFSHGQETPINSQTLPMYSREEYYNDTYGKE
jgi:hypothetical protein